MATISQQRVALADAVSHAAGMRVSVDRPTIARQGAGWVNLNRVVPSPFSVATCDATFAVVLTLGSDERRANELASTLSVAVVNAVTTGALHPSDVSVEPAVIPVGDATAGDMYALILTLTLEVA